jgi:hypothetical protein
MIWPFSDIKKYPIYTTLGVYIIGSNKCLGNIFQYVDLQNLGLVPSMCLSPVSIGLCSITHLSAYMVRRYFL